MPQIPTPLASADFKAVALDPGGTTGFTIAKRTDNVLNIIADQRVLRPRKLYDFLWTHNNANHIICEDFEFRKGARAGLDLTPAHLIGIVYCLFEGDERLRMQKASYGKSHFKEDRMIKDLKLWIPGKPHAMDSLRHFLQWYFYGPGYRYHNKETVLQLDPLRPT